MMTIPGISPAIIEAAGTAVQEAYLESFHAVWYAAISYAAVGLISKKPRWIREGVL